MRRTRTSLPDRRSHDESLTGQPGRVRIEGPLNAPLGLPELKPLWLALHRHHRAVAAYPRLMQDMELSWELRRGWYRDILARGGAYFVARDDARPVGYAMTQTTAGPDDTFVVIGGIVEVVSLVVAEPMRGRNVGSELLAGVRRFAAADGIDTLKVAVMIGNTGARRFYTHAGFEPAEEVLYLKI